jgi:hypothetical protein
MKDWVVEMQEAEAARKAEEAAAIAAFVAAGKVKHLGYCDEKYMKKVQRNWNRSISPTVIAEKKEEEQYCIFSKEERRKL